MTRSWDGAGHALCTSWTGALIAVAPSLYRYGNRTFLQRSEGLGAENRSMHRRESFHCGAILSLHAFADSITLRVRSRLRVIFSTFTAVSAIVESMQPIVSVTNLSKTYASGFQALKNINLAINRGEIFALLGPNGAGKTTLISIVCGIVNASEGSVTVDGRDIAADYRGARSLIGLVPQELTTDSFETVRATVSFSRGLFGKPKNPAYIEKVLRDLSLWEKRDSKIITLSGGMKRRVLIAKALSHEPRVLFLDEPTAGVDVELRRDMWKLVRSLAASGVTIILTTHYIDEAEEMADRIGVINGGEIMLVEEKTELMRKLGKKQLTLQLETPLSALPAALAGYGLDVAKGGNELIYTYEGDGGRTDIIALLKALDDASIRFKDLHTTQSSLEDIFVSLLRGNQ